jgi:pseudouridine-5'-phosphate glycosidase
VTASDELVRIDPEVDETLRAAGAVVALESTIFSNLGLPSPHNAEALDRCVAAVRRSGAVPAVTAVLDGVARVGLSPDEHQRILGAARKASARDLPIAIAQRWQFGATTVSGALRLAARAGISVFATGGIGGVHRGDSGDVSADLGAIARHPLVTVSAGAKAFLDLPRTLEHLEMLGVPVLGFGTDELPAFTVRSSGLPLPHRVDTVDEAAAIARTHWALGDAGGILLTVPIPESAALPAHEVEQATERALTEAAERGLTGAAVTPFVLEHVASITGGRTVAPNVALAEHNASIAGALAVVLAQI